MRAVGPFFSRSGARFFRDVPASTVACLCASVTPSDSTPCAGSILQIFASGRG